MKVLLVAPPIMDYMEGRLVPIAMDAHRTCPPYGMYLLASTLRAAGHEVALADLIAEGTNSIGDHATTLGDFQLVGIGCTSMSWPTARDVIRQIRAVSDVPIVLGGIHPTMFDRYILSVFPVDYVIRGEGELALNALVDALEHHRPLHEVPNLSWCTEDGAVVRNPIHGKIAKEELPSFPLPNYADLPDQIYHGLAIESSRGCVFDCSFCSTSYRTTWRGMEGGAFVDRLEAILPHADRTLQKNIQIIDDEFSMNPARAIEIVRAMKIRKLEPKLVFDSRANDLLFPGYVETIAPYTSQFLVGAECGYDEGLKRIGKGTTCEKLEKSAEMLKTHGIADRADYSFIVGLPWETKAQAEQTVDFALALHGKYGVRILLQWYCQIPGSRLWDRDYKEQIVNEAMYNDYGFFRDLYLFLSAVKLTPDEIYEIGNKLAPIQAIARAVHDGRSMIEHSFPMPIAQYYPPITRAQTDTGLQSLREVAQTKRWRSEGAVASRERMLATPIPPGIPLRHFEGVNV